MRGGLISSCVLLVAPVITSRLDAPGVTTEVLETFPRREKRVWQSLGFLLLFGALVDQRVEVWGLASLHVIEGGEADASRQARGSREEIPSSEMGERSVIVCNSNRFRGRGAKEIPPMGRSRTGTDARADARPEDPTVRS